MERKVINFLCLIIERLVLLKMFYLPNNIELIFSSEVANLLGEIIILNFISLLLISFCSFFPNIIQPLFLAFSFFFF